MHSRYTLENLTRAVREPALFVDEVRRLNRWLNHRLFARKYGSGFDIFDEDWDTLFILDGCRYDVFRDHADLPGEEREVVSKGGHSLEFMERNFVGQELHDTVYITPNPWSEEIGDDVFFLIRTTYTDENRGGRARLPEDVAELAMETFDEFPNKRYIVHFMQPNNPYVGPTAADYRERLLREKGVLCTEMNVPDAQEYGSPRETVPNLRRACKKGYISRSEMFEVYVENLELVVDYVQKVADHLGGRTALTADHGDMFGERLPPLYLREYSHFSGVYSDQLRNVPWLVMDSENRRSIQAEPPLDRHSVDQSAVEEHLESMGYLSG